MDVSVVIVNYNTAALLPEMMGALRSAATAMSVETIIIDNASRDNSVELIRRQFPDVRLIANPQNVGFGRANNLALPLVTGRYILLLNTDAFVLPDTLLKTVAYMDAHPKCGILGVKLTGRDGSLQPSARYFPTPWNTFLHRTGLKRYFKTVPMVDDMEWDHESIRPCDWVPGCFYLVRRDVISEVGLFDPRFFLYFEEVDHCFAAKKAGWEVVFFPFTTVVHIGGESAKSDGKLTRSGRQLESLRLESEMLYYRKNHGLPGALANLALSSISDILVIARRLLPGRSKVELLAGLAHMRLLWATFWRTAWGRYATR